MFPVQCLGFADGVCCSETNAEDLGQSHVVVAPLTRQRGRAVLDVSQTIRLRRCDARRILYAPQAMALRASLSGVHRDDQFREASRNCASAFQIVYTEVRAEDLGDAGCESNIPTAANVGVRVTPGGISQLRLALDSGHTFKCVHFDRCNNVDLIDCIMEKCVEVETVSITNTPIDTDLASWVSELKQLREIFITGSEFVDGSMHCLRLGETVERCRVLAARGVIWEVQMPRTSIKDVAVMDTPVERGWCNQFSRCAELEQLYLQNCSVDDSDLGWIAGHGGLRICDFTATDIGERTLAALAQLPGLRALRVTNTNVTCDAFWRFEQLRPDVVIVA